MVGVRPCRGLGAQAAGQGASASEGVEVEVEVAGPGAAAATGGGPGPGPGAVAGGASGGGSRLLLRCGYLVAADGAHSGVRGMLGGALQVRGHRAGGHAVASGPWAPALGTAGTSSSTDFHTSPCGPAHSDCLQYDPSPALSHALALTWRCISPWLTTPLQPCFFLPTAVPPFPSPQPVSGLQAQHLINVHFRSAALSRLAAARPAMLYFVFNPSVVAVLVAHDIGRGEFVAQVGDKGQVEGRVGEKGSVARGDDHDAAGACGAWWGWLTWWAWGRTAWHAKELKSRGGAQHAVPPRPWVSVSLVLVLNEAAARTLTPARAPRRSPTSPRCSPPPTSPLSTWWGCCGRRRWAPKPSRWGGEGGARWWHGVR